MGRPEQENPNGSDARDAAGDEEGGGSVLVARSRAVGVTKLRALGHGAPGAADVAAVRKLPAEPVGSALLTSRSHLESGPYRQRADRDDPETERDRVPRREEPRRGGHVPLRGGDRRRRSLEARRSHGRFRGLRQSDVQNFPGRGRRARTQHGAADHGLQLVRTWLDIDRIGQRSCADVRPIQPQGCSDRGFDDEVAGRLRRLLEQAGEESVIGVPRLYARRCRRPSTSRSVLISLTIKFQRIRSSG